MLADAMTPPAWFVATILVLNLGASATFLCYGGVKAAPWALIYLGAAAIQAGTLMLIGKL